MRLSPARRSPVTSSAPASAPAHAAADGPPCLQGRLDQLGLSTLLTVLEMERWSGVLLVRRNGEVGRMWLSRGNVIRARTEGSARLSGKIAAFDLLAWGAGRFQVTREEVEVDDEIDTPTTHLLMEAARKMDEAGAVLLY